MTSYFYMQARKTMIRKKLLFFVLAITVEIALLIKCPLFVIRQLSTTVFLAQACPSVNNASQVSQVYVFTMVVYSGLFIGRWFETLVLHIHIYKFLFSQTDIPPGLFFEKCKQGITESHTAKVVVFVTALVLSLSSIAIPILGIILEIKNGEDSGCDSYVYGHHSIYWILDIIRYIHDVVIRLLLLVSVVGIKTIWSENEEETRI